MSEFNERNQDGERSEQSDGTPNAEFPLPTSKWEVAKRLQVSVKRSGGNQRVADRSGVPIGTLNNYLAGKHDLRLPALVAIASACGVNLEWLASGQGEMMPGPTMQEVADFLTTKGPNPYWKYQRVGVPALPVPTPITTFPPPQNFVPIPHFDVKAAAGTGEEVFSESNGEHIALSREWIAIHLRRIPENLAVIEAAGNSMSPTIDDGDIMIVDTSVQEARAEGVYVLSTYGGVLVKRIRIALDGSYFVISDNPDYPNETVKGADRADIRVVGQVLWCGRGVA